MVAIPRKNSARVVDPLESMRGGLKRKKVEAFLKVQKKNTIRNEVSIAFRIVGDGKVFSILSCFQYHQL